MAATSIVFGNVIIFISLVFLPNMLLAILFTIEMKNKNSWKILLNQAELILLPMFTFFTYQRLKLNFCSSSTDPRVRFSSMMTQANIILTLAGYFGWILWIINVYHNDDVKEYLWLCLNVTMPMLMISIFLTELYVYFCHLEKFCCSTPKEEIHIYDPDQPEKHFVLKEEQVVEINNDDDDNVNEPAEFFNSKVIPLGGDKKCVMISYRNEIDY